MRTKLFLLLAFLTLNVQAATIVTNVSRLSGFGFVSSLKSTDYVAISVKQDGTLTNDRLRAITGVNFASSLTNYLGIASTGTVSSSITALSNSILTIVTNGILIAAGTNIVITTNVTSSNITYTISVTNAIGGSGGDSVWTNDQGVVHFTSTSGKLTNDFQIHTNGAVSLGKGAVPFWLIEAGGEVGVGGESFVGVRSVTLGDIDWNEWLIGLSIGTTNVTQDHFMNSEINRRTMKYLIGTNYTFIDEYVEGDGNVVYSAVTNGLFIWNFSPNRDNAHAYVFDTLPRVVPPDLHIVEFNNNDTNMMALWGDGKLAVQSQITNYFLTASKFVLSDAGKGLVSSAFGESDFTSTNTVYSIVTNYVQARLGSNFINLSVQAAKLPIADYPAIGSEYKNWELIFFKTNVLGAISTLNANWQFVVPQDYATNSLQLYMQQMILQTNGPATSNSIFCASCFKSTPGDSVDIHTNLIFNSRVCVTNTWSASTSGTNKLQTSLFTFGADAPVQPGDFVVLNLLRNATNDTYGWEVGVVGLQLLYSRP